MSNTKPAITREALTSYEGIDAPNDKVLKLNIGPVELPDIEFV